MGLPYMLIATAKVRHGDSMAFNSWKVRHDQTIAKYPGFIGCDFMRPTVIGGNDWAIVITFGSEEELNAWQKSEDRARIVAEGLSFFEEGSQGVIIRPDAGGTVSGKEVTEVIFSSIRPGKQNDFLDWSVRMQAEQAKYPGYGGMYLQPPAESNGRWTSILRYETGEHLEAWMNAPERARMLEESRAIIDHEELTRLATSFPGWVPVSPGTGKGRRKWKTAMLVLLGLFPIVMLERRFLSPILASFHLHASTATFISNAISAGLTSFITMPLFVRCFGWWIFLDDTPPQWITPAGIGILVLLFAIEVVALWNLLPW